MLCTSQSRVSCRESLHGPSTSSIPISWSRASAPSQKKSEANAISVARCSASVCLQRPKAALHKASGSLLNMKELQCDAKPQPGTDTPRDQQQRGQQLLCSAQQGSSLCSQGPRCDQLHLTWCGHPSLAQPASMTCLWPALHRPQHEHQHS